MAKRFHDTEIWEEDWFIALPRDYRDLWLYIKDTCDHAGIWRPKIAGFNKLYECEVNLIEALRLFNQDRPKTAPRVIVLKNGRWLLTGFIPFQYGTKLNLASPMHRSIYALLIENEVSLTSIRPLVEVSERSWRGLGEVSGRVGGRDKDKDKDKDKEIRNKGVVKGDWGYLKNERFMKVFNDYLEMRKQIRKDATSRAQELVLKELHKFDIETAISMLEQSIVNSWQGVFPLKEAKSTAQPKQFDNTVDKFITDELGKIATRDMIKKVLRKIPQNLWWKVEQYLRRRYPGSTGNIFAEVERELIAEERENKKQIELISAGIGGEK